jgi:hypothetical protein
VTEPGTRTALTARQRALRALADELTPVKSLARLDAATGRVVTTVSVVGTLLTGFGLAAAGLPGIGGAARALAVCSVVLAVLAVLCALIAQTLTVTRGLNTNNLLAVGAWYERRFTVRAPLTRAASVLLVAAVAVAGTAAVLFLTGGGRDRAAVSVTRTAPLPDPSASAAAAADTVTVEVTFRGVDAGQVAAVTVAVDGRTVAQAAITPTVDGVATRTLTVDKVPASATVTVQAQAGRTRCTADGRPGQPLRLTCRPH